MTTPADVLRRRREARAALIDHARQWVDDLDARVELVAAVVVGSVARGDFHDASDVDVIVVAEGLSDNPAARWQQTPPVGWCNRWRGPFRSGARHSVVTIPWPSTRSTMACGCEGMGTPSRLPPATS